MIPQPTMSHNSTTPSGNPTGGRLVAVDGRTLPLRGTSLRADACAGIARVVLEQTYVNPYEEPLRVTYQVPLPADGAVSGFRFTIDGQEVVGRVDTRKAARERFEEALVEGRTAAILEEDRSSLFTQEVGNIPAGAQVVVRIEVDQPLTWMAETDRAGWEWRFPTVVAPRYLGAAGRVPDAARVETDVTTAPMTAGVSLHLVIRDDAHHGLPESPSHTLVIERDGGHRACHLASGTAALDRDVVIRWPATQPEPGVTVDLARPGSGPTGEHAYALLTITPPGSLKPAALPRDLIVLLDTSGSMHGEPIDQAKRITGALIESLDDRDQLELIEFSTSARRWNSKPVAANARNRKDAQQWLADLRAGGGTQMRTGILEALEGLRPEAQRQVVLISDGLIGFESEIIDEVANRLPSGSRLHTIGVGSAVNRSLTGPAARAGRGLEVILGIGEDPERASHRLLARTRAPLIVDVTVTGTALLDVATRHPADLFAVSPVLVPARVRPEGGSLVVRGRGERGPWEQRLEIPASDFGEGSPAIAAVYARERVEDLEIDRAAGSGGPELDAAITRLGLEFQISTRLTSWVAISAEAMVDPREPTRQETMPQALPYGMSVMGLGLRETAAPMRATLMRAGAPAAAPAPAPAMAAPKKRKRGERLRKMAKGIGGMFRSEKPPAPGSFDDESVADAETPMESTEPEMDGLAEEKAEDRAPGRSVKGRWSRIGDRWMIEIQLDATLQWEPTAVVKMVLEDGRTLELAVHSAMTTRAGKVLLGATVRIALDVDTSDHGETPVTATFTAPDGATWSVDLRRGG